MAAPRTSSKSVHFINVDKYTRTKGLNHYIVLESLEVWIVKIGLVFINEKLFAC